MYSTYWSSVATYEYAPVWVAKSAAPSAPNVYDTYLESAYGVTDTIAPAGTLNLIEPLTWELPLLNLVVALEITAEFANAASYPSCVPKSNTVDYSIISGIEIEIATT